MKRLSDNAIEIVNELHTERLAYEGEYVPIIDALNRLAEYEDTGLTPKEIEDMVSVREITPEAEYAIDKHANNLIQKLDELITKTDEKNELQRYKEAEEQGLLVRLPCRLGIPVYWLWGDDIFTETIEMICVSDKGFYLETENMGFDESDIGKVVFLTREAAKKALENVLLW